MRFFVGFPHFFGFHLFCYIAWAHYCLLELASWVVYLDWSMKDGV